MAVSESVYTAVMEKYNCCCAHCGMNQNVQWHHMMANTKPNIRKYPLFIDSEHNGIPLCGTLANGCHDRYPHLYKRTDAEAEEYELILGGGR